MLDQRMLENFNSLLALEAERFDDQLRSALSQLVSDFARSGMLQSSAAILHAVNETSKSLEARADLALVLADRVSAAAGFELNDENAAAFATIVESWTDEQSQHVKQVLESIAALGKQISPGSADRFFEALSLATSRKKREIRTRFDMAAMSVATAARSVGSTAAITVNGPVGVLQMGNFNSASAVQNLDSGSIDLLSSAMQAILHSMVETKYENHELRELVEDTKSELAKPKPNSTKIKGAIVAIAETVKFVPAMKAAYDTIKPVASSIYGMLV